MAERTAQEAIDEMLSLRDVPDPQSQTRAAELESKLRDGGYGPLIDSQGANAAPPEKSFLETWGRPIAQTGGSLIGGAVGVPAGLPGVMAGGAAGQHAAGMAWDYLTDTPAPSPAQQTLDAGFGTMGGPSVGARKAPSMIADDIVNRANGTAPSDAVRQRASDLMAEKGANLTAANRGSSGAARAEAWSESSPFAVDIWTGHREKQLTAFDEVIEDVVPRAGTRHKAGTSATQGFEEGKAAYKTHVMNLYNKVDDVLKEAGGSTLDRIEMPALRELSEAYKDLIERDGHFARMVFSDPDLQGAMKAIDEMIANEEKILLGIIEPGQAPIRPTYDVIKRLRTIIGNKIDDGFNVTGERGGQKLLYGTLSDDLETGIREIGGEAAVDARKAADAANTDMQGKIKILQKIFGEEIDPKNPEAVYTALSTAIEGNVALARQAKDSLPKAAWDDFVDTYLYRATRGKPGTQDASGLLASPRSTTTNIAKLKQQNPEGYRLLIEGKEEAMDAVEHLAQSLNESEKYLNRSQTGGALQLNQFLRDATLAGGAAATAVAGGGGPTAAGIAAAGTALATPFVSRAMAKALVSDSFARAVKKVSSIYSRVSPEGMPVGKDLVRALIAAGANEEDVMEVMEGMIEPPLSAAQSALTGHQEQEPNTEIY